ncbi:MAG: phosphate/phosphite/phosphonate ABC transporter substrate-binding protein [Rivularia sp. (in: cyanobacteria)]
MRKTNHLFSKSAVFVLITIVAFINASCSTKVSNNNNLVIPSAASSNKNIQPLIIGVLPTQSLKEQQRMIEPLEEYSEQSLETQVNFQVATDYKQVVKWLVDEKIDIAYVSAVSYLEAREAGAQIEPLVAPIDKYTGRPWYRSVVVVKADSNIKTLQQLRGKRFAFVNKSSTSGYLMPFTAFKKLGINPEEECEIIYPGTHAKTLAALKNGDIDAATTNFPYYLKQQKLGKLKSEFQVIWESPPIPPSLIVVSKKLSPDTIKKLKTTFLKTPEGIEDIFEGQSAGYTSIEDADYTPIRKLRDSLNLNKKAMQ